MLSGALVLDSQGLALVLQDDPDVRGLLARARTRRIRVVVSGLTLLEAQHPKLPQARLSYVLSQLVVEDVTASVIQHAMRLLREAGLHGHKYAIDAVAAATALSQFGPATMVTSDSDDMSKLCGKRVSLVQV